MMAITIGLALSLLAPDPPGTRWIGITPGPYAVGFEQRTGTDREWIVNATDGGTRIGLAIWYPAAPSAAGGPALTAMDYRLLAYSTPPAEAERRAKLEREAQILVESPHVGIVALTREQALRTLVTSGVARRGLPPAKGRFPVVMILGGQYYLSTTAEILASHGFLVVAPFRFVDLPNEIGEDEFTWSMENSVRDAEWAASELRNDARADLRYLTAVGHGGGGLQATLLGMRNRLVTAVATIDAGTFSQRTGPRVIPFYSPRLMRRPYLYIATAATRQGQDLFSDFLSMNGSERFELILQAADLRHHDLSDIGRGVTALELRGAPQADVQRAFADVQDALVRFVAEHSGRLSESRGPRFTDWLSTLEQSGRATVSRHPAQNPE